MSSWGSSGIDVVTPDGVRCLSIFSKAPSTDRFDFLFTAMGEATDLHWWREEEKDRFLLKGQMKDRGDHRLEEPTVQSSTSGLEGQLGRLSVAPESRECEIALPYDASYVTADPTGVKDYTKRKVVQLEGEAGSRNNYEIRWSAERPSTGGGVSAQLLEGGRSLWVEFRQIPRNTSKAD